MQKKKKKGIIITLALSQDICSRQVLNLKTCVIHVSVQETWGSLIIKGQMAKSPGYYLHLASITQIIIDSVSAVMK